MVAISILIYGLGIATGFLIVGIYGAILANRDQERRIRLAQEIKHFITETEKKLISVRDKMSRAQEITEEQLDIMYSMEGPQKGVLDGKNRKSLQLKLKTLEQEKMEILESVVKDGHNPTITILNEFSERESLKLSEFLERKKQLEAQGSGVYEQSERPERPKLTIVKNNEE